jgi:archaellum component FlaF (FlaF/FlaG flagellin family)
MYSLSAQIFNTGEDLQNMIIVGKVVQGGEVVKILSPRLIQDFKAGSTITYSSNFSTDYLMPGPAYLIVEVRDSEGRVIHENQLTLTVLLTQKVRINRFDIIPPHADIKSVVHFYLDIDNIGNLNITNAFLSVDLLSPNQTEIWSTNITANLNVGERRYIKIGDLYTAGLGYETYPSIAKVYKYGALVEGGVAYSALSVGPKISVERNISPSVLPPGNSTVTVNITIRGQTGKPPADIVILVDSTNESGLEDVKTALTSFVNSLEAGDRVALVSVSNITTIHQNLTTDRQVVLNSISGISAGASELRLGEGINKSVEILLENGRDGNNWYIFTIVRAPSLDDPIPAVEYAAENGIPVYMVIYAKEGEG